MYKSLMTQKIRHLISPAQHFRNELPKLTDAVFPHMGEQSQKYRTAKPAEQKTAGNAQIVFTFSFSFSA